MPKIHDGAEKATDERECASTPQQASPSRDTVLVPRVLWTAVRLAEQAVDDINLRLGDAERARDDLARRLGFAQDTVDRLLNERDYRSSHVRDLQAVTV